MPVVKVAIVGMGNVGSGVAKLLLEHGDRLARHAGRQLVLEKAIVRDPNKVAWRIACPPEFSPAI